MGGRPAFQLSGGALHLPTVRRCQASRSIEPLFDQRYPCSCRQRKKDPRGYAMVRKLTAFAILATGMFIAGLANAEAQQPELNAPDLVLVNGKVLTLNDKRPST